MGTKEEIKHGLYLLNGSGGRCDCGEEFEGTPSDVVEDWELHVSFTDLLEKARISTIKERNARSEGELMIRELVALGIPARAIAEAIGNDDNGVPLVTPTLILRLGRSEHSETPRRRYRKRAAPATKKTSS